MNPNQIAEALKACELFVKLTEDELRPLVEGSTIENYEAGDRIFNQGDYGNKIYVILEGHVLLERDVDLKGRKGKVTIAILGRGRALGCWSTLLGEPHFLMSTALCHRPTRLISMQGDDVRRLMKQDPAVGFKVLEGFAHMLRDRIQGVYGAMENL